MARKHSIITNNNANLQINIKYKNKKKGTDNLEPGDVYFVDLGEQKNHIQGGVRPAIVLGDSKILQYSKSRIVQIVPLTTVNKLPNVHIEINEVFLHKSYALPEQVTTVDVSQFLNYKGRISNYALLYVKQAVRAQLGL